MFDGEAVGGFGRMRGTETFCAMECDAVCF